MDVGESQLRREMARASQVQKERDEAHARELETVRDSYRRQLRDVEQDRIHRTEQTKKETDSKLQSERSRFDDSFEKASDQYQKSLEDERQSNYNRFGKLRSEYAQEQNRERAVQNKRLIDSDGSNKNEIELNQREQERRIRDLYNKFENDRAELKRSFDEKLSQQNRLADENLARTTLDAREKLDQNTRRLFEESSRQKLGDQLRYSNLAKENESYAEDLKKSYGIREKQLVDDKSQLQRDIESGNAKTFSEYRQKTSDSLRQAINDSNFQSAEKDRKNTDILTRAEHDHHIKEQDMRANFRRAENDLKHKNQVERDRNLLKEGLNEKRHQQETYMTSELMRQNEDLNMKAMRERFGEKLRDVEEANAERLRNYGQRANQQSIDQANRADSELAELKAKSSREINEMNHRGLKDKNAIIRQYEQRQNALEDLRTRQTEGQKEYYSGAIAEVRQDAAKKIGKNSRENQAKLYEQQEMLRNRTNELEEMRRQDLNVAEDTTRLRIKRLSEAHSRALIQQKENFDETNDTIKYESQNRVHKLRSDSDHELRMQMLEMQSKNKNQALNYEARITQLKDEHGVMLEKMKADNEKVMRESIKKIKDQMEAERSIHAREMDIKEFQNKEKIKNIEDGFKEQIEKLKRSNELSLKKS